MRLRLATVLALAISVAAAHAEDKHYKITYISGVTGNPFYTTVACGAAEAAKRLGVTFDAQGPQQYNPALQLRVLNAVIASQPDGIMFSMTDPVALTPTLIEAKSRGIKVMAIDGDLADRSVMLSNIQSNNVEGGRLIGEALAKLIDGKGKVLAITNTPGSPISKQRIQGFEEALSKHPGITFLGTQYSNNQTAKAASIVTATLAANPDLNGVFGGTTNNTEGAATGVREAQMEGKIKVVGFDTSDPIVEAIRKGVVSADVVQFPYGVGQKGLEMMVDALNGKPVERDVSTPFVVATPQNIDTPEVQKFVYKTSCPQ
jgi:ribose transport system substrate-binding protein